MPGLPDPAAAGGSVRRRPETYRYRGAIGRIASHAINTLIWDTRWSGPVLGYRQDKRVFAIPISFVWPLSCLSGHFLAQKGSPTALCCRVPGPSRRYPGDIATDAQRLSMAEAGAGAGACRGHMPGLRPAKRPGIPGRVPPPFRGPRFTVVRASGTFRAEARARPRGCPAGASRAAPCVGGRLVLAGAPGRRPGGAPGRSPWSEPRSEAGPAFRFTGAVYRNGYFRCEPFRGAPARTEAGQMPGNVYVT